VTPALPAHTSKVMLLAYIPVMMWEHTGHSMTRSSLGASGTRMRSLTPFPSFLSLLFPHSRLSSDPILKRLSGRYRVRVDSFCDVRPVGILRG
jgi:hypothetical protein